MLLVMALETPNDELETLSDREFIRRMAEAITEGLADVLADIHVEQDTTRKQLDHIDAMLHEMTQFLDEHKPALNRALGFLDAGRSMRGYLAGRPRAGGKT